LWGAGSFNFQRPFLVFEGLEFMDILLSTINSRYHHSAFGLRYLYANLEELKPQTRICEFVLGKNPRDIVENLLAQNPKIIGLGVYIWNTSSILEVVSLLKKLAPEVFVVLGGPEISYETENQELFKLADCVIKGEAEFLFRDVCRKFLAGETLERKIIEASLPEIKDLQLPYAYYTDEDVAHRVMYVEASRGCPYKCEYCLSSLDKSVRNFETDSFLQEIDKLILRGARSFKFVDRTFNLSPSISGKILRFFLERVHLGLFLHFEMVPDRLPADLQELIVQFPRGALQFEIGVQTWNPSVAANVSRRQDYKKIVENFRFLQEKTGVHTHADLIVGLPGETFESFAQGFDALTECGPDEIQVGILKRLKGTPIVRHDQKFKMVYADQPPFQILRNADIDFALMQKFVRFAQFWDLYANSGNFLPLMVYFKEQASLRYEGSLFRLMWDFSGFLTERHGQAHAISRSALVESAKAYLTEIFLETPLKVAELLEAHAPKKAALSKSAASARQQKHLLHAN
jgi:radical SAM superfamily enzyme YgiQ (UPF0313 family)